MNFFKQIRELQEWRQKRCSGELLEIDAALTALEDALLHAAVQAVCEANGGRRYSNTALAEARARHDIAREAERAAFAAAVADWRKGSGPVLIEREAS